MKLHPISISQLNYLDSGQFVVRFLTDFEALGLNPKADPEFNVLYRDLKSQSPKYNEALMQIKAKAESEELGTLDSIRDKKVISLRRAHSAFEYTDDAAEMTAYKEIKIVLNNYKGLRRNNYEAESLAIDNMLGDLHEKSRVPAMEILGLNKYADKIAQANTNFKEKFNSRSIHNITETVYDTKKMRTDILNTYKELAEYVLVMAKRKKTNFYLQTYETINNGRQYFANIMARHQGGNNKPQSDEQEQE